MRPASTERGGDHQAAALPCVVVPFFNGLEALDACLAALDRTLPAGTRVHLADDASTDPRVPALVDDWRRRTRLGAHVVRRGARQGFAANANAAFAETGDADLVVLSARAEPAGDWLPRLAACAAADPPIASASPWSNDGEILSFPHLFSTNPWPEDPQAMAHAASSVPPRYPRLPVAPGFCLLIRRAALRGVGGFDPATFGRGVGGVVADWCLRAAAHGWVHALCDDAYVAYRGADDAMAGDVDAMPRLEARWPGHQERIARFLLDDPLAGDRARRIEAMATAAARSPQGDLFR